MSLKNLEVKARIDIIKYILKDYKNLIPIRSFEKLIFLEARYQEKINEKNYLDVQELHSILLGFYSILEEELKHFVNLFKDKEIFFELKDAFLNDDLEDISSYIDFLSDEYLILAFETLDLNMADCIKFIIKNLKKINLASLKDRELNELTLDDLNSIRDLLLGASNHNVYIELIKASQIFKNLNFDEAKISQAFEEKNSLEDDFCKEVLKIQTEEFEDELLQKVSEEEKNIKDIEEIKEEILSKYSLQIVDLLDERTLKYLLDAEFYYQNFYKQSQNLNFAIDYFKAIEMQMHLSFVELVKTLSEGDFKFFAKQFKNKQNNKIFSLLEVFEDETRLSFDDYWKILKNDEFINVAKKQNPAYEQYIRTIVNSLRTNVFIKDIRNSFCHASYFSKSEEKLNLDNLLELRNYIIGKGNILIRFCELNKVMKDFRMKGCNDIKDSFKLFENSHFTVKN